MKQRRRIYGYATWRLRLAFFFAGADLDAYVSRRNRLVAKMAAGAREAEIIKLLEVLWQKTQGTDLPAVVVLPDAIALIKGESN